MERSDDPYAAIAPYYDLEFAEFDADVDLYLGYAGIVGGPILELGCGSGRLLEPLARAGYEVIGIDRSPAMVALARRRLAAAGLSHVEVHQGDMTDLGALPASTFKLVFSAINSFLHLDSREQQLKALASIRRVLHDDGILILDIFQPTPQILLSMDDQLRLDGQWLLDDGSRLDRLSHRRLHVTEQIIETTLYYDRTDPSGGLTRTVAAYTTRYVHRFELEGLLAEAGFALEGVYGSYQLDPLDDASAVMVVVAHRRPREKPLL